MNGVILLFAIGLGFGVACWACGTLLDKSNNIGDSVGRKDIYGAYVSFTVRKDRMNKTDRDTFCKVYAEKIEGEHAAPGGNELVHRLTRKELKKYKSMTVEEAQAARTIGNPAEDEFNLWDSKEPNKDLKGVFKPLDEEE